MNVLVCCEESQAVTIAFRNLGITAFSCDIQMCSGGHLEWHICGDVIPLINGNCSFTTCDGVEHSVKDKWDLLIAHPPCTYLSNAGSTSLFPGGMLNAERFFKGLAAKEFFMQFYNANCDRICIENPVPAKIYDLPPYSQIIQPWAFGHDKQKRTCLWLKGLPPLLGTCYVENPIPTNRAAWYNSGGKARAKNRSKTFPGIARAMALQWSIPNLL